MEIEKDGMLPFLGTQLLNRAPQIEAKVYVDTGLLVHYQSHVDNRYKRNLLTTMLDRAYRLSSSWLYFSEECERLSLYSHVWTTLTTLPTPPLIPLSTRKLLTSSHCRIREDWREMM